MWSKHSAKCKNGAYFTSHATNDNRVALNKYPDLANKPSVLLHRLIACLAGLENPQKYDYVDHIDRITTDNRIENLRWASQSQQNENTAKRKRKSNARELPSDLKQEDIPKFVVWYCGLEPSNGDKNNMIERRYFKIEKHPAIKKPVIGTKSSKVSNVEKLTLIKIKLAELDAMLDDDPLDTLRPMLIEQFNAIMA
jgi:hypothetical protein